MSRKILFIQSQIEPPCLKSVKEAMRQSQGIEVLDAGSLPEASLIATSEWCGVVVCCISNKSDLLAVIGFLTTQTEAIKEDKTLRVIAFNSIPNQKLQGVLLQKGLNEILDFKVPGKTFLHKIKRHLMLIKGKSASDDSEEATLVKSVKSDDGQISPSTGPETLASKKLQRAAKAEKESQGPSVQMVAALTHPSDYWLMRSPPDARRLMGRWMVELIGPSPSLGAWVQIPLRGGAVKGQGIYEWKVNEAGAQFKCPTGRWLFIGRQVEFAGRANRWRFVGDKLSLSFHEDLETHEIEKAVAHRFIAESTNELKIAANSDIAMARKTEIEQTLLGDAHRAHQSEAKAEKSEYGQKLDAGDDSEASPETLEFDTQENSEESAEPAVLLDADAVAGTDEFKYQEEIRKGTELSGTFEKLAESEELSITLDKPRVGEELSVTLDKPRVGNVPELTMREDKAREAGSEAKRDNIFNSGQGITQGHKSDSVKYDEEFSTAEDAFRPVGLKSQLNSSAADTLEFQGRQMTLRVTTGKFTAKNKARLEIQTLNLSPPGTVSGLAAIISVESEAETEALVVCVELTDIMLEAYTKIQDAMETRQMNVLRFLKLAKGA
jgi:hypothetical protein